MIQDKLSKSDKNFVVKLRKFKKINLIFYEKKFQKYNINL